MQEQTANVFYLGQNIHGFKLVEEKIIDDIQATGRLFVHQKTKTELFYLSNDDSNKVFSITFNTPSSDSTGVAHIIEHSVLCGSRKYPLKEPFVELLKGSLHTYLNAFTSPSSTSYPVASQNEKDLLNLMDVYMDAVLFPNIHNNPNIFKQEGWHYHLEKESDPLTISGVVYNEMKGVYASPTRLLYLKTKKALLPETVYKHDSGGDPADIPNLTLEQFLQFHRTYYHPSNSKVFLYGDGNIATHLQLVNKFFELFDYQPVSTQNNYWQEPSTQPIHHSLNYSVNEGTPTEKNSYMAISICLPSHKTAMDIFAANVLGHIIIGSTASPIRQALLKSNILKDVRHMIDNYPKQDLFSIFFYQIDKSSYQKVQDIFWTELKQMVKNGIDPELVASALHVEEFDWKELDAEGSPKGNLYQSIISSAWLNGHSPFSMLSFHQAIEEVKKQSKQGYFEHLINQWLINNPHQAFMQLHPVQGLSEITDKELHNKLQNYKETLSPSELNSLVKETEQLLAFQNSIDSEDKLKMIPLLTLKDVQPTSSLLPLEIGKIDNIPVYYHLVPTNGIHYYELWFNLKGIKREQIPFVSLFTSFLSKVNTKNYSYTELSKKIELYTGGISFYTLAFENDLQPEKYNFYLNASGKCLAQDAPKFFELLKEIILTSDFTDNQRIQEILQKIYSNKREAIKQGSLAEILRVQSYYSTVGQINEELKGLNFLNFLDQIQQTMIEKPNYLNDQLNKLTSTIFNQHTLEISFTADQKDKEILAEQLIPFYKSLPAQPIEKVVLEKKPVTTNEAISTAVNVQYVAMSSNMRHLGLPNMGVLKLASKIMHLDYFWNQIRVQGGAYGGRIALYRSGQFLFSSYRDPHLQRTLDIYKGVPNFLRNFKPSSRELTKFILGCISDLDSPYSPSLIASMAFRRIHSDITQELINQERLQLLNVNIKDFEHLANILEKAISDAPICVLGKKSTLESQKHLFSNIIEIS